MKTESEIETLLRQAPAPKPTPQLAATLKSAIKLSGNANGADLELSVPLWRRWFPALAYAVLILGCVVVLAVQTSQQRELIRQNGQLLEQVAVAREAAEEHQRQLAKARSADREIEQLKRDSVEADRLAERLAQLQSQIAELSAQANNLEAQLAVVPERKEIVAPFDFFNAQDGPMKQAKDEAAAISCVNNMKQIGLAFRIRANENDGWFPPNLNSVSNELSQVRVLCCPADTANLKLAEQFRNSPDGGWSRWPVNGGSYEVFLSPRLNDDYDHGPNRTPGIESRVVARCRIHGHVTLGDGSVLRGDKERGLQP